MFGIDTWLEHGYMGSTTLGMVLLVSMVLGLRHASDPDHLATRIRLSHHRWAHRPAMEPYGPNPRWSRLHFRRSLHFERFGLRTIDLR